jgi:hypothetical protein
MRCGVLQEFGWFDKGVDLPTHRIEKPARGLQDRRIIVQEAHRDSFFIERNHVSSSSIVSG